MRVLGLIGGATWRASAAYYVGLNEAIEARLGGGRSADLRVHSLDYAAVAAALRDGRWRSFGKGLGRAARGLRAGGADGIALCSHTLHAFAPAVAAECGLPVIHAADALAAAVRARGADAVTLYGTRFTVTEGFYAARLAAHGVRALRPADDVIAAVDALLLGPLAHGAPTPALREAVRGRIAQGPRGVPAALVCTELSLLGLGDGEPEVPVLDGLALHVTALADWALGGEDAPARPQARAEAAPGRRSTGADAALADWALGGEDAATEQPDAGVALPEKQS